MDLSLSEEQELLKETAKELFKKECPSSFVREMKEDTKGYSPELWREIASLGWLGLSLPEEYGGFGSFLDLCVLLEEMGEVCFPGPFFTTMVLGGLTITDAGSDSQKNAFLPRIAEGDLIMTLALNEPSHRGNASASGINVTASEVDGDYVLQGTKLFVPYAHISDWMVVVAKTKEGKEAEAGISLFLVETKSPGIATNLLRSINVNKECEVVFNKVKVPRDNLLGKLHEGWSEIQRIIERAAVAKCCESVGGAQHTLDLTVNYAKERIQFGRPIGSFQAIQHHCANMAISLRGSRLIAYQAASMLSQGLKCHKEVAMAKAWVSESYRQITSLGLQIHGGMGFTADCDIQLYCKQALVDSIDFGDTNLHRQRVAQESGLTG